LSTEIFEALQILKSAYRNGHIAAADQASRHVDALIAGLDDIGALEEDDHEVIEV
jgi:hypothetical protein